MLIPNWSFAVESLSVIALSLALWIVPMIFFARQRAWRWLVGTLVFGPIAFVLWFVIHGGRRQARTTGAG